MIPETVHLLKTIPSDFVVREIPLFEPMGESHEFDELVLTKSGLSTFEAIALVAEHLGVSQTDISYAGLKDEDGHTTQMLTTPALTAKTALEKPYTWQNGARWLRLSYSGPTGSPKRVGELLGNSFRVVVRGLSRTDQTEDANARFIIPVLNYYDTQRFGVPEGPLLSDRIGQHLIVGEYDKALELLGKARLPESKAAQQHVGSAKRFFNSLDQRIVAFWHSAWYSHLWNEDLGTRLAKATETETALRRGRVYLIPSCANASEILNAVPLEIPYRTVRTSDRGLEVLQRSRPAVLLTSFFVTAPEPDELHPDCTRLTLQFTLPSGAYATFAVYQALRAMCQFTDNR